MSQSNPPPVSKMNLPPTVPSKLKRPANSFTNINQYVLVRTYFPPDFTTKDHSSNVEISTCSKSNITHTSNQSLAEKQQESNRQGAEKNRKTYYRPAFNKDATSHQIPP